MASGRSRKDSSSRRSDRIRGTRRRKGSCGPRTRHQSLPGKKSGEKSPRWILHLRPRRRCFETSARIGSARIDGGDLVAMNLPADHIERIKEFGYSESEARFLYIVAVHSGYFTLGQFRAFTGAAYGKRPTSFAQKVLKRGHATIRDYMRRGSIFHLFSRTIYGQIDKDNLRNRKRHSFDFMRSRLVLLDFILANQDLNYFETEQDKVRFFCDELGVSKDSLPAKVYEGDPDSKPTLRYFVDKFPLFLSSPFSGAPPVVTLSYVDSGFETSSHFVAHLGAYQGLFRQLKSFRFLYVAAKDAYFQKAEERFRSLVKRPLESDVSGEILRYFHVRGKWERHEYVVPIADDLEFLRDARRRFHGDRFESLYQAWRAKRQSRNVTYGWSFRNSSPTGPYSSRPSWYRSTVHLWQRSFVPVTGA